MLSVSGLFHTSNHHEWPNCQLHLSFSIKIIYHFPLSLEFWEHTAWKLGSIGISGACFLRNREHIGFRAHKNRGFGIMLPNAKLILELGSCLLLLGAQKFGNRDIVNAYLLTYLLTYLKFIQHIAYREKNTIFFIHSFILRCWGWLSSLNWIGALSLTLSLLLKLPPRKHSLLLITHIGLEHLLLDSNYKLVLWLKKFKKVQSSSFICA